MQKTGVAEEFVQIPARQAALIRSQRARQQVVGMIRGVQIRSAQLMGQLVDQDGQQIDAARNAA